MKNVLKKFLAMFAALAVMVSVVMPVFENNDENTVVPMWDMWDEEDFASRD